MKRKMLSSLLSIAMILSMTATAFAEEIQIEAVDGQEIIVEAQEEITEGVDIIADADIIENAEVIVYTGEMEAADELVGYSNIIDSNISGDYTITANSDIRGNVTVNGNLTINADVNVNGNLTVTGNLIIPYSGGGRNFNIVEGASVYVKGKLEDSILTTNINGTLTVDGNAYFRRDGSNSFVYINEGAKVVCNGTLDVDSCIDMAKNSTLTVKKDLYLNMGYIDGKDGTGEIYVGGNITVDKTPIRHISLVDLKGNLTFLMDNNAFNVNKLSMSGSAAQSISRKTPFELVINQFSQSCPNVNMSDAAASSINNLASDANLTIYEGKISFYKMIIGAHKLTLNGNMSIAPVFRTFYEKSIVGNGGQIVVTGDLTVNGDCNCSGGTVTTNGSYTQSAGTLSVGNGTINVAKDFTISSAAAFSMTEENGTVNVGNNFNMNSNKDSFNNNLTAGVMNIKGNVKQDGAAQNFVATGSHRVVLCGTTKQEVYFKNVKNQFAILELKQLKSQYLFQPEKCWVRRITVEKDLPFADCDPNKWYAPYVQYVYEAGLMAGYDGVNFGPNKNINRQDFAVIIYSMAAKPNTTYTRKFSDVPAGKYYSLPITWCVTTGVVSGYTNGKYGVGDNIERQQLATMLYRYARYLGRDTSKTASLDKFADAGKVSEYAKIPVAWCVQTGILSGKTANGNYYVDPKGFATRAECATMISQYLTTK